MTTETYHYSIGNEKRVVTRAPKQRLIHIHQVCEKGHQSINYTAHLTARKNLSKNAFLLFDYLEFIPNDFIGALSSSNLYAETTLKEASYAKAFQELIDKGYLVKAPVYVDEGVVYYDTYHFYEDPKLNKQTKTMTEVNKPTNENKPQVKKG